MGSKSRLLLIASMGGLLLLTALTATAALTMFARVHAAENAMRARFMQSTARLQQIRDAIYLSGTLARDYFVDPAGPTALAHLEEETRHNLKATGAAPLRAEALAYFRLLDFMIEMQQKRRASGVDAWFRGQLAERRAAMLNLAASASTAIDREWQAGQQERDAMYAGFRWALGGELALVFALGVLVSVVTVSRVGKLEAQTRALSAQLVQAQEDERRAIARELHDEVGQSINAILLHENAGPLRSRLEEAVASVRRIALSLRPSMLDDLGLVPALEWQAREIGNRTGLNVEIDAGAIAGDLPDSHRTCIFRVVQEALRNSVRHAGAHRATVGIVQAGRSIELRVEDDGRGFTPSRTRGLGLLGMEERVAQLGGTFRVTSEPGRGTIVRAELPL
jgi:signal transduction histidine kinase